MNWREVEPYMPSLSADGKGHLAYFDKVRELSFVWDGDSEAIEVSHGGYGEPVKWLIPAFVGLARPGALAERFAWHCVHLCAEWDARWGYQYGIAVGDAKPFISEPTKEPNGAHPGLGG